MRSTRVLGTSIPHDGLRELSLVIIGSSAGGIEACEMVELLAARKFDASRELILETLAYYRDYRPRCQCSRHFAPNFAQENQGLRRPGNSRDSTNPLPHFPSRCHAFIHNGLGLPTTVTTAGSVPTAISNYGQAKLQ
jgi:hypothetical protein